MVFPQIFFGDCSTIGMCVKKEHGIVHFITSYKRGCFALVEGNEMKPQLSLTTSTRKLIYRNFSTLEVGIISIARDESKKKKQPGAKFAARTGGLWHAKYDRLRLARTRLRLVPKH